eukprot:2839764-Prymnesium_polylepis.1
MASVTALAQTSCLQIDRTAFHSVLGGDGTVLRSLLEREAKRRVLDTSVQAHKNVSRSGGGGGTPSALDSKHERALNAQQQERMHVVELLLEADGRRVAGSTSPSSAPTSLPLCRAQGAGSLLLDEEQRSIFDAFFRGAMRARQGSLVTNISELTFRELFAKARPHVAHTRTRLLQSGE